jgi:hypothetical protein
LWSWGRTRVRTELTSQLIRNRNLGVRKNIYHPELLAGNPLAKGEIPKLLLRKQQER